MANPRAFVSFDFDNNEPSKIRFIGQSINSRTPFSIEDWSAKSSMPQNKWEELVKDKISKTNMLIVLVGQHMATATGVRKEIQMAKELDIPIFGVYVSGANTTSNLPTGLSRNRTIAWKWEHIANAIKQVMGEGRNVKR